MDTNGEITLRIDENFMNEFEGLDMKDAIEKICSPEYMLTINERATTLVGSWLEDQSVPEQDIPAITERYMQCTRMVLSQIGFLRLFQVAQKHTTRRYEEDVDPEVQQLITNCLDLLTIHFEPFSIDKDFDKQMHFKNNFLKLKQRIAAKVLEGTRASPDNTHLHVGVIQRATTFELPVLFNRAFSGYAREIPGPVGQLMANQLMRMLPEIANDAYARTHVGVFSSGMSGFKAIKESLGDVDKNNLIIAQTVYFEIPIGFSDKFGHQPLLTSPDRLKEIINERVQKRTDEPLVVYLQRLSSNPDCTSSVKFGAEEAVETLEKIPNIRRPIIVIEDTTMDPLKGFHSLNELWPRVNKLIEQGADITVLNIASLIKHGQYGLDAVSGGIGAGIGNRPEILDRYAAGVGANISEHSAAMLFPLDFISMAERVSRAEKVTKQMCDRLVAQISNSLLEVRPIDVASEEQLLYLRPRQGVPGSIVAKVVKGVISASYSTSLRMGTSYGFDNPRYSVLNDQDTMFRLTPGQQTSTELASLMDNVLEVLTSENAYEKLKTELSSMISLVNIALSRIKFEPLSDGGGSALSASAQYLRENYGDLANFGYYTTVLAAYPLLDMLRGGNLKIGERTIEFSEFDKERLVSIQQEIPDKYSLELQFFKFALNLPEVISDLQRAIPVLGKLSPRTVQHLCKTVIFANSVGKSKWRFGSSLYKFMSGYYQHI